MNKFIVRQNEKTIDGKLVLQMPKFLANNGSWTDGKSGLKEFSEAAGIKHIETLSTKFGYKLQSI
jgi:hypothetical protein